MQVWLYQLFCCVLLLGMFGCGGEDAQVKSTKATASDGTTLELTLLRSSDSASTQIVSTVAPGRLVATLENAAGAPLVNYLVTFSTALAILSPTNGQVLTNSAGEASVTLLAGASAGAGTVTATVTVELNGSVSGNEVLSATLNFQVDEAGGQQQASELRIGNGSGTSFVEGVLSVGSTTVGLNQTLNITATLVDSAGDLYDEPVTVAFNSICLQQEVATLDESIETVAGIAVSRYTATDCFEQDIITASAVVEGRTLRASVTIDILATSRLKQGSRVSMALTSLDSSSNTIRIDAPGSLVATVVDGNGQPVVGAIARFATDLGTINPSSGSVLTNANGQASVELLAGSVTGAGSVTVTVNGLISSLLNFSVAPAEILLGSGNGVGFIQGDLAINVNPLSAGGTTTVTASVVSSDFSLFTLPVDVSFISGCVTDDKASLDAVVTTVNGVAQATYRAQGCVGNDTIDAQVTLGGTHFSASRALEVLADVAGSIEFVTASPNSIALVGTGGQGLAETATVSFRVKGSQGLPLANQTVNFGLTTAVGGIQLSPSSAVSDAEGLVSTVVQSGSVAVSVGVIATVNATSIKTQSDLLSISTGVPDQDSMTLSASTLAPEALNYVGETITLSAFLGDAFNNPVPDGTAVTFTTEGGSIVGSCTTAAGSCSSTWTSQQPIPGDGLVTILATAIGNESFADENGNGVFDDGDTFSDLSEAFRDDNFDGVRDAVEPYVDFNLNASFDAADGLYSGILCNHSTLCSSTTNVSVRAQRQIVMSGSRAHFILNDGTTIYNSCNNLAFNVATTDLNLSITVQDVNGNSMPEGSTVTFATENGELLGIEEATIPNTLNPMTYQLRLTTDGDASTDVFAVTVQTPKEEETVCSIFISD